MAFTYGRWALSAPLALMLACSPADEDTGLTNSPINTTPTPTPVTPVVDSGLAPTTPVPQQPTPQQPIPSTPTVDAGVAPTPSAGASLPCNVKAVLDKNCIVCHDGKGSFASPMGLLKYDDLIANAPVSSGKKVFQAVGTRIHDTAKPMPPAGVLSADQLKVLDDWIAAGAPKGTETCTAAPAPTKPAAVWPPPEGCDAIYKITSHGPGGLNEPFAVAPGAETHPQIAVDPPWGNEKVQAIAFRVLTDNTKVLHHWILYNGSAFLTGWAPGDEERPPFPKDVGMDLPTGPGSLRLDMHYNSLTATQTEMDKSGVEVCVVKGAKLRPKSAAITMSFAVIGFPLVPPNANRYEATAKCKIVASQPIHLMSASPHSHTYAVAHKFTVKRKNGTEVVMLDKPFQFGEQKSYPLDNEVILENGDTVTTTCVYSNKTSQAINFGEDTGNEMCFNFASYYPKDGFSCDPLGGILDF